MSLNVSCGILPRKIVPVEAENGFPAYITSMGKRWCPPPLETTEKCPISSYSRPTGVSTATTMTNAVFKSLVLLFARREFLPAA
jgi:hypothetical protein